MAAGWPVVAGLLAVPVLLPIGVALTAFARPDAELWAHLTSYVLPEVLPATLWLLVGVACGVALLGSALAALVALFEFPGRAFFSWALLLPLAVPGYVLATVFIGMFDYAGGVATWLRDLGIVLPDIRSRGGVVLVMTLTLYPYVYLVTRSSLATQGARMLEAARLLGLTPGRAVLRVALPLAAPAIAGGTVLASMETLADFGTVAAFNYDTFTTAIYKAWFALFSIDSALQLAGILVVLAALLLWLQTRAQGRRSYVQSGGTAARIPLHGAAGFAAAGVCALVLLVAFVVPASQLVAWSLQYAARDLDARLLGAAGRSVVLGLVAATLTATVAVLLAYAARRSPGRFTGVAVRLATLGYAAPGALLAIGLFVPVAAFLRWSHTALGVGALVQGGLLLMLLAYVVRFSAVAHAPVAAGLHRIKPSLDEAAQLAGVTGVAQLARVHVPLLRPGLAAALALVFVDVMKEMPITLMTRPFGWDTLSVRVFELTSEGEWQRAALPSLAIVVAGLVPVWLLTRTPARGA